MQNYWKFILLSVVGWHLVVMTFLCRKVEGFTSYVRLKKNAFLIQSMAFGSGTNFRDSDNDGQYFPSRTKIPERHRPNPRSKWNPTQSSSRESIDGEDRFERRPRGDFSNRASSFQRNNYDRRNNYRSSPYPRNFKNFKQNEERPEPVYGHYDGDHIYGTAPILAALKANRRQFSELIIQEGLLLTKRKSLAQQIVDLAKEKQIPLKEYSKHDLNMMSENRPHQGFILRAKPLSYQSVDREVLPPPYLEVNGTKRRNVILALDEVMDPQNLGALLRSCYYLGCSTVIVSAKNSAPLTPVVSKASAGAMELMTLYSTKNLMSFLERAKIDEWVVVGTATAGSAVAMDTVPNDRPLILVLGNEGYGLRKNILSRCDYLVSIPRGHTVQPDLVTATDSLIPSETSTPMIEPEDEDNVVDSLNVSVTGGILLHYYLH